jgi:ketosteroid isomerase-like protein
VKNKILPLALLLVVAVVRVSAQGSPQAAVDEMLAADRAFSAASSKTDFVSGLSAMFGDDVVLTYAGGIASGKARATEALRQNPANTGARIEWTPVRAALSGDGRHGFTAGFMTLRTADGKTSPLKYLAYWEKKVEGWRVVAYKRGFAKTLPALTPMPNVLPAKLVKPTTDAAAIEGYRKSLADAETAFSNLAQKVGIKAAFTEYGRPDALNLGPPDVEGFLIGNHDIGSGVGGPGSEAVSPVKWGPDYKTIVAASGDFGVTIGYILRNAPGPDGKMPPPQAFFTIWKRDSLSAPWRYIAE